MQGNQGCYGIPRRSNSSFERLVLITPDASSNAGGISFTAIQENSGSCWAVYLQDPLDATHSPHARTRVQFLVPGWYSLVANVSFTTNQTIAFLKNQTGTSLNSIPSYTDGSLLAARFVSSSALSDGPSCVEYFNAGDSVVLNWNSASGAPGTSGNLRITRLSANG